MLVVSLMVIMVICGFILMYLTEIIPLFQLIYMDWIGAIIIAVPTFIAIIVLATSKSFKIFEKPPPGKYLMFFLRRDGIVEPLYGTRPFHGESFLEIPKVGLIHDLGKGSVYRLGNKNVRFALENVNHTPNPTYANYTNKLYEGGFDNIGEIESALNGEEHNDILDNIDKVIRDKYENERETRTREEA